MIALMITAASLGFFHTLFGPDHYVPFIVMLKSRGWSYPTPLCGFGHIFSSILLGAIGLLLGIAVGKLEFIEGVRGEWASWGLIAFGLIYLIWGLKRAYYYHEHDQDHEHSHGHTHHHSHTDAKSELTFWGLFIVFVLGPCEPLIPLLMFPGAEMNLHAAWLVSAVFGLVTIATMLAVVTAGYFGLNLFPAKHFRRFAHPLAGASILLCGLAMVFLGL